MDLKAFPMDTQKCLLTFESYNYNNKEVQMVWNRNTEFPILMLGKTALPDFLLINTTPHHKSAVSKSIPRMKLFLFMEYYKNDKYI